MAIIQLLLLLSAFSAPGHLRTFFIIEPKIMGMLEAQAACKMQYDIVTIYNDAENDKLAQYLKSDQKAWIGLYRNQFSYKWSNGDNVAFSNLGVCCSAMKADGSWECLSCTERRNFMCYKQDVTDQTLSYHLILENKTWYEAQSYCRKNYTDLVSIREQNQNEKVKKEGMNSSTSFWIGLLYDDWEWADGGRSAYRNWVTGQPRASSNCTVMMNNGSESGKWYSVPCSNNESALCYSQNTTAQIHPQMFHFIEQSIVSMKKAQEQCRTNYTDLVTVYNQDDNAILAQFLKSGLKAWIGLYRSQSSYKWSNGDDFEVSYLGVGCRTGPSCSAMKADGSWEFLTCTERRNFMCYKQDVTSQNLSYHLILENKTWYEAQSYCRKNYTDLVSIRDQNQNEKVKKEGMNSSTSFWIGLLYDDWEWADGGRSAYRNWATGQPRASSNCTVMMNNGIESGKWYSVPCSNNESALCYTTAQIHPQMFHFIEQSIVSMKKAQEQCRTNYTDLVTVYNQDDNAILAQFLKSGLKAWIGLYRSQSSYKWSNGDDFKVSNLVVDCRTGPSCSAMKADGSWECLSCTERRNFMCYKQDVADQTLSYHLILENKTWYEAQSYCRKNYTDLVSIRDQNQNEMVKTEGKNSSTSFWIGLLYDDWEWADGGCSAYRNWATGQPRALSNCTVMMNNGSESGKWYSVPCSNNQSALCYSQNTTDIN